jgi:hypothetical protein
VHTEFPKSPSAAGRCPKAGALYFALVFAAGFVLGTIRTLWVVPRMGARAAELMEAPVMLGVSIVAASWVVRRLAAPYSIRQRLVVGLFALALMLCAELAVVFWLRRLTLAEYVAGRDPVAGSVYLASLAAFAVMPALVRK